MSKHMTATNKDVIGLGGIGKAASAIINGGETSINVWKEY